MRHTPRQVGLGIALIGGLVCAHAQTTGDTAIDQQRRAQQRETQLRERQELSPDQHLPRPALSDARRLPQMESPCFVIRHLRLQGPVPAGFEGLLDQADGHSQLAQPDPVEGRCLGAQGIQTVIDRLQNELIRRGYITGRVLAAPQNLQAGELVLTLVPGRNARTLF